MSLFVWISAAGLTGMPPLGAGAVAAIWLIATATVVIAATRPAEASPWLCSWRRVTPGTPCLRPPY